MSDMSQDKPIRILLAEDDEDDFVLTRDILEEIAEFEFELDWQKNFQDSLKTITKNDHDICFVDYRLGESDGIDLIQEAIKAGVSSPFILLTGKGNREIDQQAMDLGAADFLVKDKLTPETMERCIRYALKHSKTLKLVKEGENKFRQLFERSIDAIFISNQSHELIDVNSSFIELFDTTNLSSSKLSDYFLQKEQFEKFEFMLNNNGQVKDFEALMGLSENNSVECQLTCVKRIGSDDELIGYQGIVRDMTIHKKAEMDMLIAEKLSMTGKIARSIAHEVRNPLTNLGLALGQLEDELPKDNEDISMFLEIIDRNSKRIDQLITEMLNSSKPKELHAVERNVNDLIEETVSLVQDRLVLKGMTLKKSLEFDLSPCLIDTDKLKMALLNIMVNAIEAMKEGSGILTLKTQQKDDSVQISISDNGVGISKEDLHTLFDPFYTNKQGGMGLGLTTTQNIINSHGGSIEVTSELGEGTSFNIYLPTD